MQPIQCERNLFDNDGETRSIVVRRQSRRRTFHFPLGQMRTGGPCAATQCQDGGKGKCERFMCRSELAILCEMHSRALQRLGEMDREKQTHGAQWPVVISCSDLSRPADDRFTDSNLELRRRRGVSAATGGKTARGEGGSKAVSHGRRVWSCQANESAFGRRRSADRKRN